MSYSQSLYCFFKPTSKPFLPDPELETVPEKADEVRHVNRSVERALDSVSRKRGSYQRYDPETRAKIGRYAAENGNKAAVDKFSTELSRPVSESSVRGMKKAYYIELRKQRDHTVEITRLEHRFRGRPLLLGKLDDNVQEYIRKLRLAGCVVNRTIVVATGKGIVEHLQPALLREHGGPVELGRKWAESLMRRMGLVKRKATKAARKSPDDLDQIKAEFVCRVVSIRAEGNIPQNLF